MAQCGDNSGQPSGLANQRASLDIRSFAPFIYFTRFPRLISTRTPMPANHYRFHIQNTHTNTHTHTHRSQVLSRLSLFFPLLPPPAAPQSLQGSTTAQCVVATALHHAHHKSFSQLFFTTVTTRLTRRASETLLPRSVARLRLSSHQTPPKLIFTHSSSCMRPRKNLRVPRFKDVSEMAASASHTPR